MPEATPHDPTPAVPADTASSVTGRIELYTHEPMVNWLSPLQLLMTAVRVAVAQIIGAFADARAVQAALNPAVSNPPMQVSAGSDGATWVDYLADTGDGWHSTYSMALCVSQPVHLQGENQALPRAGVLLLGGDQVYPTPANSGYRTRFLDPFRAAFPAPVPADATANSEIPIVVPDAPLMVATPGNHDWYDGLRGFAQLFCIGEPIGGWRTAQRTSYYVLQLPDGWWIWGLDLQLESEIDRQQYEYFRGMHAKLAPGDRVVLCTPEPSWIDEMQRVARSQRRTLPTMETRTPRFRSLSRIELLLGDHLAVVLAGDMHHYARYTPRTGTDGPERFTCGGGGAFLHGTHQLPETPSPISIGATRQHYRLADSVYPDKATSRRLRDRAWQLPARNASFCALVALLYFLLDWILHSATPPAGSMIGSGGLMAALSQVEVGFAQTPDVWRLLLRALARSPSSVLFILAIVAFFAALATRGPKGLFSLDGLAGALHGLLHVALAFALLWVFTRINVHHFGIHAADWRLVPLLLIEILFLGGLLGGLLFGIWMVLANRLWGLHMEEVFSSQGIDDYKCLLRMRFDADTLTIHPLKLESVCRRWSLGQGVQALRKFGHTWRLRANPDARGPRFVPASGETPPPMAIQRIEAPIVVHRHPQRTSP